MDILNLISGTPLPTVLVVGGMLFIALALGSQIGGKIEMPAERQRLSGILGGILLLIGLGFYFLPSLLSSAGAGENIASPQPQSTGATSLLAAGDACFDTYFAGISGERIAILEAGARSQVVINSNQPKDEPIALQFTQDRQVVGALIVNFFLENKLFKIDSIVDAECGLVTSYENIISGGEPNTVHNWDQLELRLSENLYLLRFDYSSGEIKISFELIVE